MDKYRLDELANNPKNISGIFNYCDRWCERCTFTSRCLNYDIGEEQFNSESRDARNEVFWERLSEMFKITFEMLEEDMKKRGLDINEFDLEDTKKEEENRREAIKNHVDSKKSMQYADKVKEWFDNSKDFLLEKEIDINKLTKLDITTKDTEGTFIRLNDAIEVIHWYQYQIHVKIRRAISGKKEKLEEPAIHGGFPSDSDGSAKVALIGMDRSISAWGELYQQFPEKENSILELLVILEKLRKKIEASFPDARAFIRLGFDEDGDD
jgi:hypothetical protein